MTIQYAILGLLSWQSFAGYDLKKIISDSELFYWSGSNNQIYRTLVQLHEDGLVSQEVQEQENLPARKIYTLTEKGRAELHEWLLTTPELPERHNAFLIQLAWADALSAADLAALVERYAGEVETHLLLLQEKVRRWLYPARSNREDFLWRQINENLIAHDRLELEWAQSLRAGLAEMGEQP
ncbi:predicted transcriptional regulator [Longilinea arvoryzae]|uniref:Predicted transcriptional regulator n=1 Tax=Longilinea arvoryzae TaxID=360412 RepID=A0A0S7BFG3_9CHLR|nr:PadR family transcriptional regulator [Longilinea arvoryzae]GAP13315.1 predicted transcriptional regulator [Longilinea arvoryzae]